MPQARSETLHVVVAEAMLPLFGRRVPVAGRHARAIGQVALPEAVRADDAERVGLPVGGEDERCVFLDQACRAQLAQHPGRVMKAAPERSREALHGGLHPTTLALVEVLEGVLHGYALAGAAPAEELRNQSPSRPEERGHEKYQEAEDPQRQAWVGHGTIPRKTKFSLS